MAKQLVNLGTPNNNDGDSLYAGGAKINTNFNELYLALGGDTPLLDLATGLVTGNSLRYSAVLGKFVSVSSTSLRSMGANGATLIYLTNNSGVAGVDSDLVGAPNTEHHVINGRLMFTIRARTTGSTTATRGEVHWGLGMAANTSLSIYTTGVTIRGFNGLEILTNANVGEDSNQYTTLLSSATSGVILYGAPVLSSNALKIITDNSPALAHTGFVQGLVSSVQTSITVTGTQGLAGGGNLAASRTIGINPVYQPHFCDGFLYRVSSTSVIVAPGAAVHWSFGTAGAAPISTTSVVAIVATTNALSKSWTTSGSWTAGAGGRIIETGLSVATNTWYYLYLIANSTTGAVDYLISNSKTIADITTVPTGYTVVRRLGPVKTSTTAGSPANLLPFTTSRIGDNVIDFNWGKLSGVGAVSNRLASNTIHRSTASTFAVNNITTAGTSTTDTFASTTVSSLPPLPGVTARLAVSAVAPTADPPAHIQLYGQGWTSITTTTLIGPPTTVVNPIAVDGAGAAVTSTVVVELSVSPDIDLVSEAALGVTTSFANAGMALRHFAVCTDGTTTPTALTFLGFEVLGFKLAR